MTNNSIKKILIIGDSLCLPRDKPEIVNYNETWPYLLKQSGKYEIFQLALGGGTIVDLYEQISYYTIINPDIVIVQSGIVDCAPRALKRLERDIVSSNKLLSELFNRFMPINKLRKLRNVTYVNKSDFESYIIKIVKSFNNVKLFWIGVLPAKLEYEKIVPGITKNIIEYNNIINLKSKELTFKYISTELINENCIMSDNHHLTKLGHVWLYQKLISLIY